MDLKEVFRKMAYDRAFFYVTLDPERALGLEDILPNYTIICPYKSELVYNARDRVHSIQILVLEEHLSVKEVERIVERGTYGILSACGRSPEGRQSFKIPRNSYVLVLKNSQLIENFCKKQGWHLIAPKAEIAERFENKISQCKLLKDAVPYPKSFITTLEKIRALQYKGFVLQFNRGHSGNSTFFIKSKKGIEEFCKKYPKREVKISEYIKGKAYTLNCVVLRNGKVITGSLSEQITGLKTATNNPNTTCGNDFTSPRRLLKKPSRGLKKIQEIAQKVGKILHKHGYRGLFGIDVIIEKGTRRVCFIELNTHQPASISFEAKLHRKIGKTPILAYLILDYVGRPTSHIGRPPIILPIAARQIIYRNKTDRILELKDVERKYRGKGLLGRVKYMKPNEEIYRVQKL